MRLSIRARAAASLAAVVFAAAACSGTASNETADDAITAVPKTAVERQTIGNCWLQSTATWAATLHKARTGKELDVSESYWTYLFMFDQLTSDLIEDGRPFDGDALAMGGNWPIASELIKRFGIMAEKDFVPADRRSLHNQHDALAAINESLTSGALRTKASRRSLSRVRDELDKAWGLSAEVRAALDEAFGHDLRRTFKGLSQADAEALAAGTAIQPAQSFPVRYATRDGRTETTADESLYRAANAFEAVLYPESGRAARRVFQKRMQRALHAGQPLVITWGVDMNGLETRSPKGAFLKRNLDGKPPGWQSPHLSVITDYQATVGGKTYRAGVTLDPSRDAAALDRLLDDDAQIEFFRIKNSWGTIDRTNPEIGPVVFDADAPGYNDLYLDYLEASIPWCADKDTTKPVAERDCQKVPSLLYTVVLPPGY